MSSGHKSRTRAVPIVFGGNISNDHQEARTVESITCEMSKGDQRVLELRDVQRVEVGKL